MPPYPQKQQRKANKDRCIVDRKPRKIFIAWHRCRFKGKYKINTHDSYFRNGYKIHPFIIIAQVPLSLVTFISHLPAKPDGNKK